MSEIHYVNMKTGRIVLDPKTIEAPESQSDYIPMNEKAYRNYCVAQRRKLDKSKEEHQKAEEEFNEAETLRVNSLVDQISNTLGISKEDAETMVPRRQFDGAPDFSVSEKVFGDIVLPEEEG